MEGENFIFLHLTFFLSFFFFFLSTSQTLIFVFLSDKPWLKESLEEYINLLPKVFYLRVYLCFFLVSQQHTSHITHTHTHTTTLHNTHTHTHTHPHRIASHTQHTKHNPTQYCKGSAGAAAQALWPCHGAFARGQGGQGRNVHYFGQSH